MSKYHAKKVLSMDGIEFDSKLEAKRWDYLRDLEEQGKIRNLLRQVEYEIIPKQEKLTIKQLKRKVKAEERLGEHPVTYIADFVYEVHYAGPIAFDSTVDNRYYFTPRGELIHFTMVSGALEPEPDTITRSIIQWSGPVIVVEDTKGIKTRDYILKRKLMRYLNNIAIREVKKPYEEIW